MPTPTLIPLDDILPHEMTIPSRARRVLQAITVERRLYRPLIVEARTLTLIDGHHRLQALTALGARYAPAILVDYHRDIQEIQARPRSLPYPTAAAAEEALREHARRGPAPVTLQGPDATITILLDPADAHILLGLLEAPGPVRAQAPPLTPQQVLSAASRGLRFPPRTTFHVTWAKKVVAPVGLEKLF